MEAQLRDFERTYAGQVQVNVVPKARYGRGGLLDLLRAAQPVAPAVLPDLVLLDIFELEQAVSTGLLQPLDQLLTEEVLQGLYPFARTAGRFQGRLLAVQYVADLEHIIFLSNVVPNPPQTWDDLLRSSATSYLFPLGVPQPGANTSRFRNLQCVQLSHYLSAGAGLNPSTRQLTLEETPLLRLLTFYETAADAGLLPPNALEINSTEMVWNIFAQGRIPLAQVTARQYLAGGSAAGTVGYAATPGWAGPAVPVASGWALAIVTTNPRRQQLATDLIAWLLEPERAGAMARATGWLPTSPTALDTWGEQPYYAFLDQQLARAVNPPVGPEYAQTSSQLQKAVIAVLAEGVSPRDATAAALGTSR
ncbi:MAG: extracellular solute-binding protein [Anaerolineae bacterium]|nr:extracellular solute-binding protein [Anaerolineae bacterium]